MAVGPAAPSQAARLEPRLGFPLYLDQARSVREVLQLRQPGRVEWLLNLRGWLRWLASFVRNRRQGWITGSHSDLPALAIVAGDGSILYLHRGQTMGDYPPIREVISRLAGNS